MEDESNRNVGGESMENESIPAEAATGMARRRAR